MAVTAAFGQLTLAYGSTEECNDPTMAISFNDAVKV